MKNTILIIFGENLRKLREQRGLSQEQLAELSGCHRNYVGGVERGERNITVIKIMALVKALGCDVSELFSNLLD